MADNYKITISVQADPNDIKNIQSQLQAIGEKTKPIEIKLDTGTIDASLISVEKSAAKTGANIAKNINQGLVKIDPKITTDNIKKINKALDGIGFSDSAKDKVTKDLEGLKIEVTKAVSKIDKEGKVNLEVKGIAKAEDGLERVITVMQRFDKEGNKIGKGSYTSVAVDFEKQANDAYKKAKAMVDKINSLKVKKANMTSPESSSEMKQLQSEINKTEKELAELRNEWKKPWGKAKNADLTTGLKAGEREVKNTKKALGDDLKLKIDTGYLKKELDSVETKANKLDSISPELKKIIKQCKSAKTRMENLLNDGDIDGAARAFDRFENNIQAVNNQLQIGFNAQKAANASLKVLEKSYSNIAKLEKNIANLKLDPKANASQINVLEKQLEEARAEYNRLENALKGDLSDAQFKELSASANRLENELEQTNAKIADTKTKLASSIKIKMADGTFSNDLSRVETQFGKLSNQTVGLKEGIKQLRIEMASMSANANDNDELINNYERYKRVLKSVENELKEVARAEQENIASQKLSQDRSIFQQKIDAWMTDNSRAAKEFGGAMLDLKAKAESCDRVTLNRLEKEFKQIDMAAEAAGKKGLSFVDKMKSQFEKYGAYLSVASAVMYTTMALKDMARQVVAIDTAMTELKKVTNETDAAYDDFLSSAATGAKEIGTTIDGLVQSAAGFARLGYSFADSQELAKVANTYAVVGDEVEGVEGATKSLISTMAAFKDDFTTVDNGDFATSIIDKFNEVGNNFAISSGGIGEALQRSASSLAAANNTIDESIAMITAANTVVQDPARIGNAFKTISMRIRGAKTELEEAGESTDGMVDSTAKLRQEIKALSGVDIMIDKDTFKSTYQVMDEISVKWENLSDIAQASIIELMAGKHQGNVFASLMTNWETARDVLETSQNSEGSAMAEHAKWAESLEAKILKLKAAWQGFSQTVMNSDFLRGLLDTAIKALDVVTLLVDKIGVIPTLLAGFTAFKSVGGNGLFRVKELEDGTKEFTNIFKEAKEKSLTLGIKTDDSFRESLTKDTHALFRFRDAVKSGMSPLDASNNLMAEASIKAKDYALSKDFATKGITGFVKEQKALRVATIAEGKSLASMKTLINEYNTGLKNSSKICKATGMTQRELTNAIGETNGGLAKYLSGLKGTKASMGGYISSLVGATAKTLMLEAATMALNTVLTMGIGFAISAAMSAILKWINAEEELAEKVEEVTTKYKEQAKELRSMKGDYDVNNADSMISRYGELSKGVSELGENVSLTSDEYAEYQSIVDTIAGQIPSLVTGYNSQGNAILDCAGSVDKLTEAYKNLAIETNKEILDTGKDIYKDFYNNISEVTPMSGVLGVDTENASGYLDSLKEVLNTDAKKLQDVVEGLDINTQMQISDLLESKGIKRDVIGSGEKGYEEYSEHIIRAIKEDRANIKSVLDDASKDLNAYAENLGLITQAYFDNAFLTNYSHIDDNIQGIINQVASGFDSDFYSQFINKENPEESYKAFTNYLDSMLAAFDELDHGDTAVIEAAFNLKTKFNNGEISYGEYVAGLEKAGDLIDDLALEEDVKSDIKLSLGFDENGAVKEYQNLIARLTETDKSKIYSGRVVGFSEEDAKRFLSGLKSSEVAAVSELLSSNDTNFNNAIQQYKNTLNEAKEAGVDFAKTTYGNIDTNARQTLEWTNKNLDKYKEELMSWQPENVSWDKVKKDLKGSISTVMGGVNEYDGVDIAFTPMLQTDNGAEILSRETVDKYINNLISMADKDGGWTNEELIKLDAKGIEVDGKKIKGILADVGETAMATSKQMHFVGKDGALALDVAEISRIVEEIAKVNEAMSYTPEFKIDSESLAAFNGILAESASAMGLSSASIETLKSRYADLGGYDPSTLFEKTANGIKVNREELVKLEQEYQNLTETEVQEHLDTLVDKYNDVTAEIDKCTNAGERAELIAEREGYAHKIEELATYQAQLEGVTGAYQRWIDAQAEPEDYEGYEAVAQGREGVQDEIDRGFLGKATKEYIDLLSGENLVGGTIDDYAEAWEKLDKKVGSTSYSIHDFFTLDEDGNITSTGIDRFFKGMQQDFKGSVATFNKETGKWQYDFSEKNLQKIQDEWGVGIEAIELLLEGAVSAGYDIDWGSIFDDIDLDTSNFETLVSVAEAAQEEFNKLEDIEDVDFNFTATGVEQATSEVEKARSAYLDLITNDDGSINLKAEGAEQMRIMLATLLVQKQQLEDSKISLNIDTSQLDESQSDIASAIDAVSTFREKYKNLEIAVTTGEGIDKAKTELSTAMKDLQNLGGEGVDIAAKLILGEDSNASALKTEIDSAIDSVESKDIKVGAKLDDTAVGTLNSELKTNFTPEATVKITKIDASLVEGYTSTEKTANGKVKWKNDDSLIVEFQNKTHEANGKVKWKNNTEDVKTNFSASGTITWTSGNNVKVKVVQQANGTAHAKGSTSGRAFARGNWGIKGNGTALGGELGQELVVRDGRFFTIGDKGAEFFQYKQNDIIFNAAQTESLFKYGGIKGAKPRGTMLATGSAFAGGSLPTSGRAFPWNATGGESDFVKNRGKTNGTKKSVSSDYKSSKKSTSSKSSKDAEKSAEEFKETIDWIEVAIARVERAIDRLDTKASRTWKSWSYRNKNLTSEISKIEDEIDLQQRAYNRYMQEANSVGLSESYKKKVREGKIDIETIKDEDLKEKIDLYKQWYEKALECEDEILEKQDEKMAKYMELFDNVISKYDAIISQIEHSKSLLEESINQQETDGHIVSTQYYEKLIEQEENNIEKLEDKRAALIQKRADWVAAGGEVGSEDWNKMTEEINVTTLAIEEGKTAIIEYGNAIRDIDWKVFDLIQEQISNVTKEADFLIELMSNDKLYDDNGQFTDQGMATMGLHGQNYNTHMYQADQYNAEIAEIDKLLKEDPYDQELLARRQELVEAQQESILAAEAEKEAIRDMVQEGIELELDALQERIDKYEEALDAAKD